MAIPRVISDRAANIYAGAWCVGFVIASVAGYLHHRHLKWAGYALMAPFSIYVTLVFVASMISVIGWFWQNRRHR